jgi:hypothetical protein
MTMVAVTTLRDAGGAEVVKELLADHGIAVEIRRLSNFTLYFGAPTSEEFEVRVPDDRVDEARQLLDVLSEELQARVLAEAGVPPGDGDERGGDDLPPPELRPRKLAWAIAIGLIAPVPGCGLLYARAFRLGYLFVGLAIALFVGGAATGNSDALVLAILLKPLDVILAPFFAARFNRKLEEHHAADA